MHPKVIPDGCAGLVRAGSSCQPAVYLYRASVGDYVDRRASVYCSNGYALAVQVFVDLSIEFLLILFDK